MPACCGMAVKQNRGFFPSDTESPEVLEPGDGSFDGPAFLVSAQRSPVLRLGAVATIGRNHLWPDPRKTDI